MSRHFIPAVVAGCTAYLDVSFELKVSFCKKVEMNLLMSDVLFQWAISNYKNLEVHEITLYFTKFWK